MPLLPDTVFGVYEVLGPLGAGGMGEVYRARDRRLGREVAIKVLPEALAEKREHADWLVREARLLASLSHPNIAHLLDGGQYRPYQPVDRLVHATQRLHHRHPPGHPHPLQRTH